MPLLYDVLFWPSEPPAPPHLIFNKNMYYFQIVEDLLKFASLSLFCPKHNFTIGWNISEGAFLFNEPESHWKCKKVYQIRKKKYKSTHKKKNKKSWKIGLPIFALLPTPLVRFPIFLDPPSLPKIGHHLCTFPYIAKKDFHVEYETSAWVWAHDSFMILTLVIRAERTLQRHDQRCKVFSSVVPNLPTILKIKMCA